MARYKPVEYAQGQFVSISFEQQILPGSFEHALNFIVDNKLDFSTLDAAHRNDEAGAPAYDPRVMLKIVLCAYARGMVSSREIAAACEQNVVMMALSANTRPHFTTIAQFIRELGPAAEKLFIDVLMYCDELGLIGKEMFAFDGCKFPSNASKEWSGTRADFENKRHKFQATIERHVAKHRLQDENGEPERVPGMRAREEKAIEALKAKTAKIDAWLRENPDDRLGSRGTPVKSSMTDKDSAKMASSRGVIQGYDGLAAVDAKHQVIVGAEAFGKAHERNDRVPARTVFKVAGRGEGESFSKRMIRKVESELGRFLYGMRMGIVEPVFGNLRHMLGLDRFTLRGNEKVNVPWRLFAVVHNIHKAHRFGLAGAG